MSQEKTEGNQAEIRVERIGEDTPHLASSSQGFLLSSLFVHGPHKDSPSLE